MKKDQDKPVRTGKLRLQRETLRWLHDDSLRQMYGGATLDPQMSKDPCYVK